jgi:hypothetical protein
MRLKQRGIPFMIYSGHATIDGPCAGALHLNKPAAPGELIGAMESILSAGVTTARALEPS